MITITTQTNITYEQVSNLFVSAIEGGGSTYWCQGIKPTPGSACDKACSDLPEIWYANPAFWERDDVEVQVLDDEDQVHIIRQANIMVGLQKMASQRPTQFADIINENDDAGTADIFLQLVALGEEIYG